MEYKINISRVANSEEGNLKAFVNVIFGDSLKVTGVRIYDGENGLFVAMPNYRTHTVDNNNKPIYESFCNPITKEFYEHLNSEILGTYEDMQKTPEAYGRVCEYGNDELKIAAKVTPYQKDGRDIRGIGNIVVNDSFVIKNVVIHLGNNGYWVSMPSVRTTNNEYENVCYPITKEAKRAIDKVVIDSYNKSLTEKAFTKSQTQGEQERKQDASKRTPAQPKRETHKRSI